MPWLHKITSGKLIKETKAIMAKHGIPDKLSLTTVLIFLSQPFAAFAYKYGFRHPTSFPQLNGETKRAVQTVKSLLQKA